MKTHRIKLTSTIDRPHMTYEILSILFKYDIQILMMEVYKCVGYYKLPIVDEGLWEKVLDEIRELESFQSVEEIDLIAFEERVIEMKSVLDIVPQGVIVLNAKGYIKYTNNYIVDKVLMLQSDVLENRLISEFIKDGKLIDFFHNGKNSESLENMEITIGNKLFTLNIHPIINVENVFSGYMLSLRDVVNEQTYYNPITFEDIIGESNKLYEVINQAKLYSLADSPVLITGESGTGKELFARSIHNLSNRKGKPFIAINCAALPDQLLESELFGYEAGSFTGGKKEGKKGIFELGEGGTIFLDEIGEMPPHLQSKLLRVLQEKSIRRIGSHLEVPIDVRIISATNQKIEGLVNTGKFRLDLLYRINIFSIDIPPLRDRKEDIPILTEYFIKKFNLRYGKVIEGLDPKGMKKLISYNWPGNIRELQNILERAMALTTEKRIKEKDIILNFDLEKDISYSTDTSLTDIVGEFERKIVIEALKDSNSIRSAARKLNVTPTLLTNRIRRYAVEDHEWRK